MPYRFHVLGVPHTISLREYSSCAFTQQVVRFCKMLKARGHTVFHYGHEDSRVDCDEHIAVVTCGDHRRAYGDHDWRSEGIPDFRLDDPVYEVFNANAIAALEQRKEPRDFLLCLYGLGHKAVAEAHRDMIVCEPSIGYGEGGFAPFRVFQSYAVMHAYHGQAFVREVSNERWYDVAIPGCLDGDEFEFSEEKDDYFLFLGRVYGGKGIHIAVQVVEEIGARLVVAGSGAVDQSMARTLRPVSDYVTQVGLARPEERRRLLARAKATFTPSTFLEPFCWVHIESMLSGTPVISSDWGVFVESNLHGVTGYRCRTFEQFLWAARNIGRISPRSCRDWAARNFSVERVGDMYEEYFAGVMNLFTGKGWYQRNDGRQNLDWLRRYYPQDPALYGVEHRAPGDAEPDGFTLL
jgi:glycosyltransferase involved in cell wall biosynthesis